MWTPETPTPHAPGGGHEPTGVGPAEAAVGGAERGPDPGGRCPGQQAAAMRPIPTGARLLALTGALGGLGVSTLLIHLAWALRRAGRRVAIVDLDPAGGLGLLFGDEVLPGLRWADLPHEESAFRPGRLIGALPAWHTIPFLTGDGRGGPALPIPTAGAAPQAGPFLPTVLPAVLEALLCEHDVVLLDLPRGCPPPPGSQVLLLSGLDLRSAVACQALVPRLQVGAGSGGPRRGEGVGLLVRQVGEDISMPDLELVANCPVLATVPTDRAVRQRIIRGEDPVRSRSALRRTAGALVRRLGLAEPSEEERALPAGGAGPGAAVGGGASAAPQAGEETEPPTWEPAGGPTGGPVSAHGR
ncbi:cellulose synthase operon protein YhjQ/BcsQ [Actinomyces capricornis]|uniref:CobQ/CobB/MinD/ParA nucleotide binding domain-containing protein n=1 Tax=Actinomyces capricornis TaxID=2755559 RepID=A0ABM7UB35_9ACTO|nr:cellulose synthase operon protein YhjQ/BcsQ [Actinomyces capricornis]BDA64508.1 hypothetical protein MANAM107_13420 [Actinomyces capricornis]